MTEFEFVVLCLLAFAVVCFIFAPYFALLYLKDIDRDLNVLNKKFDNLITAIKEKK